MDGCNDMALKLATAALVFALTACAAHASAPLHGMQLDPPKPSATFTLRDQNGTPFSLAQTRGSEVLLYFGFTHCKDTCPQTLAMLGKARTRAGLSPDKVRIVMVTVDPAHDTPAALRAFFRKVGVRATGLTGTPAQLRRVYAAYGVGVQPTKNDILHTDAIYVIAPNGNIVETLVPEMPLKDVAADMLTVVD